MPNLHDQAGKHYMLLGNDHYEIIVKQSVDLCKISLVGLILPVIVQVAFTGLARRLPPMMEPSGTLPPEDLICLQGNGPREGSVMPLPSSCHKHCR